MTRFTRFAFGLVLATAMGSGMLMGCQGTTKGGAKYSMLASRELEAKFEADLATVHSKALIVLRDQMGFTITRDAHDALEGILEATTARKDKVTIQTYKEGGNVTTAQVWVGPFGDKGKAEQILNALEEAITPGAAAAAEAAAEKAAAERAAAAKAAAAEAAAAKAAADAAAAKAAADAAAAKAAAGK